MAVKKKVFTFVSVILSVLFLFPSRALPDDIDGILDQLKSFYLKWSDAQRTDIKTGMNAKLEEFKQTLSTIEDTDKLPPDVLKKADAIIANNKYDEKMVEFKKFLEDIEKMGYPTKGTTNEEFQEKMAGLKSVQEKIDDFMKDKKNLKNDLGKIKAMKEDEAALGKPSISIETGFKGDRAGENSLYNLDIGARLDYTKYPNEFRFQTGTSVQFKNKEMIENVSSALVNYDRFLAPWLKIYGFAERFSNTYLSIQQRYEIGTGCKFVYNLLNSKRAKKKLDQYESIEDSLGDFKYKIYESLESKDDRNALDEPIDTASKRAKYIRETYKKKNKSLELSMAFSLFADLEQAELEVSTCETIDGMIIPTTKKIPPKPDQRLRLTLRPRVVFSPNDYLTLSGHIYFKYALTGETRVNGHRDLRKDGLARLEIKMPSDLKWAQKLSFILEYQYHFDSVPPFLTEADLENYHLTGPIIAEDTHHQFLFKLAIEF